MGLDMYLKKRTNFYGEVEKPKVIVLINDQPSKVFNNDRIFEIAEDIFSWRKANQIHRWFVENIQGGEDDCAEYYVSVENLTKLKDICKQIIDDPSKGEDLLPTTAGFFFGSTEHDEYYIQDIKDTYTMLCDELSNLNDTSYGYYYQSSW